MPRGGRRPGAGAPRGNLNALKNGARTRRLGYALAAMLAEPQIRDVIMGLLRAGETSHAEFRALVVTAARVLYEQPINEELRQLANDVATAHIERLGAARIAAAVRQYKHQLGFDDLLPPPRRAPGSRRDNPVFREYCLLLLGIDPARLHSSPSINRDAASDLLPESGEPPFANAVRKAIRQSNPHRATRGA
jgi:hypothetical protein